MCCSNICVPYKIGATDYLLTDLVGSSSEKKKKKAVPIVYPVVPTKVYMDLIFSLAPSEYHDMLDKVANTSTC